MEELAAILKHVSSNLNLKPKASLKQLSLIHFQIGQTIPISKMTQEAIGIDEIKEFQVASVEPGRWQNVQDIKKVKLKVAWRCWFSILFEGGELKVINNVEVRLKYGFNRGSHDEIGYKYKYLLAEPTFLGRMIEDLNNDVEMLGRVFSEKWKS